MKIIRLLNIISVLVLASSVLAQKPCWQEQKKIYPYNDVNRGLYNQKDPTSLLSVIHRFAKDTAQNGNAVKGVDQALHDATYKVGGLNLYKHPDFIIIPKTSNHPLINMYGEDSISSDGLFIYPNLDIEYLANHECDIEVTEFFDFSDSTWKIKEITFYYFFGFKLQKQPTLTINWDKFTAYCKKEGIASNWFASNRLFYEIVYKAPCDLFSSNTISALTVKNPPYLSIRTSFIKAEKVAHLFEGGDDLIYSIYDFVMNNELRLYPEPNLSNGIYIEHFNIGLYADDSLLKNELFYYFGYLGPETVIPLPDMHGGDSINLDGDIVYPPRDTLYFKEKHIEQFRVTEMGMYNPETKEVSYKPLNWSIICKNEDGEYGLPYWININSFIYKLIDEHPSLEDWKSIVQKTIDEGQVYQLWEIKQR